MADRYEEKARRIVDEWERSPISGIRGPGGLSEFFAAALREQDIWYEIDDPEHPAPMDGTPILAWMLWYPHGLYGREEYAERNFDILRWTTFNGGGWVHYMLGQPTHWRPMPLPLPPQSVRQDG
jgi:hypothetical protein